jgi:hypothetical protein
MKITFPQKINLIVSLKGRKLQTNPTLLCIACHILSTSHKNIEKVMRCRYTLWEVMHILVCCSPRYPNCKGQSDNTFFGKYGAMFCSHNLVPY